VVGIINTVVNDIIRIKFRENFGMYREASSYEAECMVVLCTYM